ncbi:MAG: cyanate transporter [Rhizobium sp.]|nr:cyanate transporter [Rhizobium sp.]
MQKIATGIRRSTAEPHRTVADRRSLRSLLLRHPAWTVAGILLLGFNMRPAITSVAPFLGQIRQDLGMSGLAVSLLTTAPVVCLGLFAPAAAPLARRFGPEAVLLACLIGVAAGVLLRSFGLVPLFAGTVVIGASMSVLGVLSPVVIKRDFARRAGMMMGLYAMLISLGAALSTATAAPLQQSAGGSWRMALLFWAVPALVAALVFIPQLFRSDRAPNTARAHVGGLLREPLAWQVTGFFALVASLAYAVFSWGPSMLQARGLDGTSSGLVMSLSYIAQMATGFGAPILAGKQRDQRLLAVALVVLTGAGLLGILFAPVWSVGFFAIVLGLGQGGAFGLALSLIVLRSANPHTAAQLSGLTQSVGYVVGGLVGPMAVGLVHDWSGGWGAVAVLYVAVGVATLLLGLGAGRARTLNTGANQ